MANATQANTYWRLRFPADDGSENATNQGQPQSTAMIRNVPIDSAALSTASPRRTPRMYGAEKMAAAITEAVSNQESRIATRDISIRSFLTAKVSGPQNAGPLDRRVRPEGQKGAPGHGQGRSPRKSAGPRKRRSAARMIAGGACCTSAGGPKGLKAFGTGRSAGTGGCAHETGDGTND